MTGADDMRDGIDGPPDRDLVQRLDRAAQTTRDQLLARAQETGHPDLEERSAAHWQQLLQSRRAEAETPRRGIARALAAAAVLLLITGVWWIRERSSVSAPGAAPDTPPVVLDSGPGLRLLGPVGDVERIDRFHWSSTLAPGGWYELSIWDADSGAILAETEVDDPVWEPGSGWQAPRAVRWQVREFAADGTLGAVHEAQARREPR